MSSAFSCSRTIASTKVLSSISLAVLAAGTLSTSDVGFAADAQLRPIEAPIAPVQSVAPPAIQMTYRTSPWIRRVRPVQAVPPYIADTYAVPPGAAVAPSAASVAPSATAPGEQPSTDVVQPPQIPKPLEGLGFGAGVALTFADRKVESASVVNNIVRVEESSDVLAGFVLESHYFFVPNIPFLWGSVPERQWGHGPFVAIDVSTEDGSTAVTGFSMGWMIGFRKIRWEPLSDGEHAQAVTDNNSWNFGVGFRVDPSAQTLGDGIVANMQLPPGETEIRYKKVPRYGVMLITSFSF